MEAAPGRADALHTANDVAKAFLRNAVLLYHKGGQVSLALDLCFRAQLHEELRRVADGLGKDTDPALMAQCAEHFMRHGQYEKAVHLQPTSGRLKEALQVSRGLQLQSIRRTPTAAVS